MQLIYEKSVPGRSGVRIPLSDVPRATPLAGSLRRKEAARFPEVSEEKKRELKEIRKGLEVE